ncbi:MULTISPECIES: hydroxyisourate hydrolase [Microbacterium]|uniref:hydroxyisourate hydrolase n=1 Tax=Microbacterium TaxID=33882 RepID=UPI0027817DFB|nr:MULTISPECIES: hydroxyisourate hydrolase [Microbacterium]MDQ1082541.1 5-hydroxyisourate hydrolase [Microbacterium sp. SORGH_AS_0344]MDQ1168687.1 5-hydroxyisourate hydrolase [Microbacterium proteolyticum]
MTHVTTHILDATAGTPAPGVAVTLARLGGDTIVEAVTDADGRLALGPDRLDDGDYSLTFATGAYFRSRGVSSFHPIATIAFTVSGEQHLHVPLLLSPFAYSTYRGS